MSRFKVTDSGEAALETTYSYDENGRPVGSQVLSMANSPTQEYTYDLLGRSESFKNYFNGNNYVKTDYSYRVVDGNETGQVQRVSYSANSDEATGINDLPEFEYEYDANGNITHVYGGGFLRIRYHYDGMNRLAREDNLYIDKTIIYNYDRDGDILSKTEYDIDLYDEGLGEPIDVITYSYSESRWMSGITRYDGTDEISYDLNGSPIEYRGYTMSWAKDRQLSEVSGKGIAMSLKYDCNGIRTKKTVNGVETEYTYVGDMLVSQKTGNEIINFAYTAGGAPLGFTYNGTSYFYLLNLQGDIIGIYDANGNVVVGYYYDTWGKLVSIYGTLADTIGVKNPLRYRGYYYDTETSLYYLQSRYYDPETGRFISRDSYLIAGNDIIQGTNMYAYCYNNPVMYVDSSGHAAEFYSLMTFIVNTIKYVQPIVDYLYPYIVMSVDLGMSTPEMILFALDVGNYEDLCFVVDIMYNGKIASELDEEKQKKYLEFYAHEAFTDKSVCKTVARWYMWVDDGTDQLSVAKEIYAHAMMYNKYDLIKPFADPFVKMIDNQGRTINEIANPINLGRNPESYVKFYDLIWSVTNEL